LWQGCFIKRKAECGAVVASGPGIELVAKALLVSSCKESRASGAAIGSADISAGASDAIFGNRIDVGRVDIFASVNAEVCIAKIICNDDDDVWFACSVGIIC